VVAEAPQPKELDAVQEKAIVCLLNEPTIKRAAEAAGVGERTLHRWMTEPVFGAAYREARRLTFSQAIAVCSHYAAAAVHTLARVLSDPASPPASRVAAASNLLKFSRESIELDDLAARVEALEASQKAESRGDRGFMN